MTKGKGFKWNERSWQALRYATAIGVLNGCHAIEGASKAITPVHGDPTQGGEFATFAPGSKPIGGTLRRSQHSVVYLDGSRVGGVAVDDNGATVPDYVPRTGIAGFVGTNIHYAGYVHDGTVMMPARPFLTTAFMEVGPDITGYIASGMSAAIGRAG